MAGTYFLTTNVVMSSDDNNTSGSELSQSMASLSISSNTTEISDGGSHESHNNYYTVNFDVIGDQIGEGWFGKVFKVRHKLEEKLYAIKIVTYNETSNESKQRTLNEVKSLANLSSQYVVQYHNSWLNDNSTQLYIQMEYCPQSLKTVLETKGPAFGRQSPAEPMNPFEYFISCEIFKELLECVEYLHESVPTIIHRDFKPDNVLIASTLSGNNNNSRRFIKLCDFGLATVHDPHQYEHSAVGTRGYIAQEVYDGKYNHKVDIYSLSRIGEYLFDIYLADSQPFNANESVFKTCILCMSQILEKMMSTPNWRQRPECREVLAKHNEWSIDKTVVTNHKEFNSLYKPYNITKPVIHSILKYNSSFSAEDNTRTITTTDPMATQSSTAAVVNTSPGGGTTTTVTVTTGRSGGMIWDCNQDINAFLSPLNMSRNRYQPKKQWLATSCHSQPPPALPIRHQTLAKEFVDRFQEVVVIGDVHGCDDELIQLLDLIHNKNNNNSAVNTIEKRKNADNNRVLKLFVGDLVNKGPKSRQVLDYLMQNSDS
ncbi:unnamed protein product, partial [Medioppia subpectinata]